jgi:hypothetical protein
MIESRKFVAAAILAGLALIIAGLVISPVNGGARAASTGADAGIAAERIGAAFAAIAEHNADPVIAAAATRAFKSDRAPAKCAGATWPNIDAACLVTADGEPAQPVRTITVGYQSDPTTTILLRVPAAEVAQR